MASWATLATSTLYTTLLTQINDRDVDSAKAFDPANTTVTSPVTNTVRYNSANKRWERYDGAAWVELIVSTTDAYNITVNGLRGGTLYGSITGTGATITGGTVNATVLQVAGSAAWTAASLTNLNQLTNGPGYLTSASLTSYAPLASPTFTGVPLVPTAAVDVNTTQAASTAYVVGQGYLKSAVAAATYAPLGGAGTSGTWPISVTGNSVTTTQRTFSNVRTDGINRGANGSISVAGSAGGYAGIDFTAMSATLMVNATVSGVFRNDTTWDWYWTSGVLTLGTVPWARLSGAPSAVSYFSNDSGYQTATGSVANATTATLLTHNRNRTDTISYPVLWGNADTSPIYSCAAITITSSTGTLNATNLFASTAITAGSTISASGLIFGRAGGGTGLGRITTTATAGSPSGTSTGDLVFVY